VKKPASKNKVESSLGFIATSVLDSHERKLLELIDKDWETFYGEIFGKSFIDALDSEETADRHHSDALEWHFDTRRELLDNGRPDYFAYFPTWSRGNMKTDGRLSFDRSWLCLSLHRP
jgi:hypothetical protein